MGSILLKMVTLDTFHIAIVFIVAINYSVLVIDAQVTASPHQKYWFEIFLDRMETTTITPERYCVETRLKAYGHILEIYDFTQNTSPIRNEKECTKECHYRPDCNYVSIEEDDGLDWKCYLVKSVNSTVESMNFRLIYVTDCKQFEEWNTKSKQSDGFNKVLKARSRICLIDDQQMYSEDGLLYCAMKNKGDQMTISKKHHPNHNCTFTSLTIEASSVNDHEMSGYDGNNANCWELCQGIPECLAWMFADYGLFKSCTLYKHSEFGLLRFVYREGEVILGGFKYCNIASGNIDNYKLSFESTNPFYLDKGLPCNMTVPWNCRNVPTTHVEALPLAVDGKCKAIPKISDIPKICTNNKWNHTYVADELCMYCIVGNGRSTTGVLTNEWPSCRIQCDLTGNDNHICIC